jgi:hypothetical protein
MEVGARRGAHFQRRTPYRLSGLLDHILARKGYDSQQYDGFPFQNPAT